MAVTNRSQLANGTATQQGLYNQALARQAQLNNQHKYLQMAQVSPYFALGNWLGNTIADRFNSRGVNKEKKAISDALAGYQGGNQDYNAMNDILNTTSVQDASQGMSNAIGITPSGINADMMGQTVVSPQAQNNVGMMQQQSQGLNNFNLDSFKAKYFEDARKRGRTDDQINEAWSSMQPQITDLANKAKEARIDTAFQALSPNENGKYAFGEMSMSNPNFINYLRPLMKDNPEMATYLMKGATAKDTSNAALQRQTLANAAKYDLQNRNQQFQLGRDNTNNAIKLAIANGRIANKGTNNDYKMAHSAGKAYDALEKKYTVPDPNNPMQTIKLPPNQWSAVDQARARQYMQQMGILQDGSQQSVMPGQQNQNQNIPQGNGTADVMPTSTMDYDSLNSWVTKAIAEGKERGLGRRAIEGIIRDSLKGIRQDGDYLDKILNEASWDSY